MAEQCDDNAADRATGETWERNFVRLALHYRGGLATPHQAGLSRAASALTHGRRVLLPDITIWTAPCEHHEVKHKDPTNGEPRYGLEQYRLDALCEFAATTQHPVLYTIHDWRLAGAKDARGQTRNRIEDWRTIEVTALQERLPTATLGKSWVNGEPKEVPIYYWPVSFWKPLESWWKEHIARHEWRNEYAAGVETHWNEQGQWRPKARTSTPRAGREDNSARE